METPDAPSPQPLCDAPDASHPLLVVAAAVVVDGRLLVVSKQAAPEVFYLPGGKPEPGELPEATLARELAEELGAAPVAPRHFAEIEETAALEGVPMRLTVYLAQLDAEPVAAAELADLRWISAERDERDDLHLSPALRHHVLPLLSEQRLLRTE